MANQLTAREIGGRVVIDGPKGKEKMGHKETARTFNFHLRDETKLNVIFSSLAAQESDQCPADGVLTTSQIEGVDIDGNTASFKDADRGDPCTSAYSWYCSCDDPNRGPISTRSY